MTAPVGVSAAVFLLAVQLSVFGASSPALTPTKLLFNVVAPAHHRPPPAAESQALMALDLAQG